MSGYVFNRQEKEQMLFDIRLERDSYPIGLRLLKIVHALYSQKKPNDKRRYIWKYNQEIESFLFCMVGNRFYQYGEPFRLPPLFLFGCRVFPATQDEIGENDILFCRR